MNDVELANIATCDLVDELRTREGVMTKIVEPYDARKMNVEGPAVVLIVKD